MEPLREFSKGRHIGQALVPFLVRYVFFIASTQVGLAGPEGAQVVNGQASFQQSGNNTVITASDKSIINYSSFDIAQPETVQFIQPSNNASVLNRIISANPTNINGTLLANGRVFFVNPAGVIIGDSARINVSQLVASALNISDSDFTNGRYNFVGGEGSVINRGDISAERAYLIGKQVVNSGHISCPTGYVVMAAGDRVFLGEPGCEDVVLEIDAPSLPNTADLAEGSAVVNEGTVDAAGGTIVLAAAGDVYSLGISNVGSLSASIETGQAGQVQLAAPDGQISNTGSIEAKSNSGTGGTVLVQGREVINSGIVDVTGAEGGQVTMKASARLGQFGTMHADATEADGGAIDLWAGAVVALGSDSLTTANAGRNGNGGEITVFSPETALFWPNARIEAKGGSESGDGGFVEVSGKEHVEVYGLVDTRAPHGVSGTFFMDPADVSLADADDQSGSWGTYGETSTWTPSGPYSIVNADAQLALTNVIVNTNYDGGQEGNIYVDQTITDATGHSLTLQAANNIYLNRNIDLSGGPGNLRLEADWGGGDVGSDRIGAIFGGAEGGGTITMGSGVLWMTAGGDIGTYFNRITTNVENLRASTTLGNIYITETDDVRLYELKAPAGSIYLESIYGSITRAGDRTITAVDLWIAAERSIGTSAAPITTNVENLNAWTALGDIYIKETDDVALYDVRAPAGSIYLEATNGRMTHWGDYIIQASGGSLTMVQAGEIDTGGFFFVDEGNTDLILQSTGSSVTSYDADQWHSITATAKDNIILQGTNDIKIGGDLSSTNGGVSITSENGGVYDVDSYSTDGRVLDNVAITGYSNTTGAGVALDPADLSSGKAAIVITSASDLILGPGTTLTANGAYNPAVVDDRQSVNFGPAGDPVDVAIYLGSLGTTEVPGNVELGSQTVMISSSGGTGALVADAGDTVTFGSAFENSLMSYGSKFVRRIEVVSRISRDLASARDEGTLPYADNPANLAGGRFSISGGTYVLRGTTDGELASSAVILDVDNPAGISVLPPPWWTLPLWVFDLPIGLRFTEDPSLVASARSESDDYGEVEEPDVKALGQLLEEQGIGYQPKLDRAYPPSLNTDLYLYKVAEQIKEEGATFEGAGRTAISTLNAVIAVLPITDGPYSQEQVASVFQRFSADSLVSVWLANLTKYAYLLNTKAGRSHEDSLDLTMLNYVDRYQLAERRTRNFLRTELSRRLRGQAQPL